ncbi:MAG: DUF6250 domain-containing protein [Cellvibrio sp.]
MNKGASKIFPRLILLLTISVYSFHLKANTPELSSYLPCDDVSTKKVLAHDDFTHGLKQWIVEQQDPNGKVTAKKGVLDVQQPAGATLWFRKKLTGDYVIEFTATPIPLRDEKGGERISDLNMFWNANDPRTESRNPTELALDGALTSYNPLHLYYVGFGANYNTTTRLRRYDGGAQRSQITGYTTPESATSDDRAGGMTEYTRLNANEPVRVRVVSRKPNAQHPENLWWYANDKLLFSFADPKPYLEGWFGFRTTFSHFQIRNFKVYSCRSKTN